MSYYNRVAATQRDYKKVRKTATERQKDSTITDNSDTTWVRLVLIVSYWNCLDKDRASTTVVQHYSKHTHRDNATIGYQRSSNTTVLSIAKQWHTAFTKIKSHQRYNFGIVASPRVVKFCCDSDNDNDNISYFTSYTIKS